MRKRYAISLILAVAVGLGVCYQRQKASSPGEAPRITHVYLGMEEPVPRFDAYLTWENYDPVLDKTDPDHAPTPVYILDGKQMGSGEGGFRQVVAELAKKPRGSVLLMYPAYELLSPREDNNAMPMDPPFARYGGRFWDLLVERGFTIIYSPKDEKGNLHPFFVKLQATKLGRNPS
jgi:hypothetical protein